MKETRQKQVDLWTELILLYCRQKKVGADQPGHLSAPVHSWRPGLQLLVQVFIVNTDTADDSPLFCNKAIESAGLLPITCHPA